MCFLAHFSHCNPFYYLSVFSILLSTRKFPRLAHIFSHLRKMWFPGNIERQSRMWAIFNATAGFSRLCCELTFCSNSNGLDMCALERLLTHAYTHTHFSFHLCNEIKSTLKLWNTDIYTQLIFDSRDQLPNHPPPPHNINQYEPAFPLASFVFFGSCFGDWT